MVYREKPYTDDELRRLVDRGLTQKEIAEHLQAKYHQSFSRSGISTAMSRLGLRTKRPRDSYADLIPWVVAVEHADQYPVKMLRLEARKRRDLSLSPDNQGRLESFKQRILDNGRLVVDYHPDDGFSYVPARPGIDTDLIRVPDPLLSNREQRRVDALAERLTDRGLATGT